MRRNRNFSGFTLSECLVVLGVLTVLLAIVVAALQNVRESARRASCQNSLRQIGSAVLNFESAFHRLPVGSISVNDDRLPSISWLVQILPYIDQPSLWETTLSEYPSFPSLSASTVSRRAVGTYGCPSDGRSGNPQTTHGGLVVGLTSYLGISGISRSDLCGVFVPGESIRLAQVIDGLSQTAAIGERPPSPDNWYGFWFAGAGQDSTGITDVILGVRETNLQNNYAEDCPVGPYEFSNGRFDQMCDTFHFWSPHPGGALFLFLDGATRFVAYQAEPSLAEAATRNGRETAVWFGE